MRKQKLFRWKHALALFGMTLLLSGCGEKDTGSLPAVSTSEMSDIKDITATGGGSVTSDGDSKIVAIGLCWSKEQSEPTVSDSYLSMGTYTVNGIEESDWEFSGTMTELLPTTNYYVRAYAANEAGVTYGETKTFVTKAGKIFHILTPSMIETYTQEIWEGPKEDLIDGTLEHYWHSAYSDDPGAEVHPLPHWIQINFAEARKIGGFIYWHRNPSGTGGRPTQFDLQVSDDGNTWTTVWTSQVLSYVIDAATYQDGNTISFGQNFTSSHFRLRIIASRYMYDYTYLAELKVFEDGTV